MQDIGSILLYVWLWFIILDLEEDSDWCALIAVNRYVGWNVISWTKEGHDNVCRYKKTGENKLVWLYKSATLHVYFMRWLYNQRKDKLHKSVFSLWWLCFRLSNIINICIIWLPLQGTGSLFQSAVVISQSLSCILMAMTWWEKNIDL